MKGLTTRGLNQQPQRELETVYWKNSYTILDRFVLKVLGFKKSLM